MTKDLSKQICEKCGIEPKKYEYPSREYDSDGNICSYYVEEIYPDFGQPENFVKLFELKPELLGSLTDCLTTVYNIVDRKTYLECLLDYISIIDYESDKLAELLESIREAEWKYE